MAVIAVKQRQKILLGKTFRCCKRLRDSTSQPLIHPVRRFFPNIRTDHRDPVQPIAKPNDLQKKLHRLLEASGFFKNLKGRGNHAALEIPGLDLPLPFFSILRFQFLALAEKIAEYELILPFPLGLTQRPPGVFLHVFTGIAGNIFRQEADPYAAGNRLRNTGKF